MKSENKLNNKYTKTQTDMDIQSLIDMCTKKLDQEPNHKKALLLRASSYIKKNELEKAAGDVRTLILNNKNNSTAYYLLGCIYEKKGELEKSIESFNQAIETDSNNVNALFSRGAVYNMLGNYQKAIDDYYLALETDSKRKTVYNRNLGRVLGLNNDTSETERSTSNDQTTEINNQSKNYDNLNIDGDINQYVYSQLNDLAIRNTNNMINLNSGKLDEKKKKKKRKS